MVNREIVWQLWFLLNSSGRSWGSFRTPLSIWGISVGVIGGDMVGLRRSDIWGPRPLISIFVSPKHQGNIYIWDKSIIYNFKCTETICVLSDWSRYSLILYIRPVYRLMGMLLCCTSLYPTGWPRPWCWQAVSREIRKR